MRTLTLIRHAKSSWKDPELDDFLRPLNKRGKRDLPLMVERLAAAGLQPDLCLTSAANRAITTAQYTCAHLENQPPLAEIPELYESCKETLLNVLQQQSDQHHYIMMFGHNPGLQQLGEYITGERFEKFPTCAVMHIHLSITCWSELAAGCGTLNWLDYPKLHLPYLGAP